MVVLYHHLIVLIRLTETKKEEYSKCCNLHMMIMLKNLSNPLIPFIQLDFGSEFHFRLIWRLFGVLEAVAFSMLFV